MGRPKGLDNEFSMANTAVSEASLDLHPAYVVSAGGIAL